jgi:anaerobic magnesium-protoporphyrin IX monomethyl ester cyclase
MDCLFVNPNSSKIYQKLAENYSAIEPPTWSLLLAQACRKEFGVGILDCDAERLSDEVALQRIIDISPRLVCFVVYGQNPNSGTTNMSGAISLAKMIKDNTDRQIAFIGSHTSALPEEVLTYKYVDFVIIGDGLRALKNLLRTDLKQVDKVKGLGYKQYGSFPVFNDNAELATDMDNELPGYAWDLLPYKEKPLDLYRSHFWHTNYDHEKRSPFAAIYSSLGCNFSCSFCMISSVNRTSLSQKDATESRGMRFWSPDHMINIIEELVEKYGVETLRFSDEMFLLNKKYYEPLLDKIIERGIKINTWTYSRIDTVRQSVLDKLKKAGVNWLGLGVEAANQQIRKEIDKGRFEEVNIREVMNQIKDAGINRGANYIFGFPNEKMEDLQATLDLSMELNTEFANFYTATALPGSLLYRQAKENNWKLPSTFEGFGFLAKEFEPLPTNHLTGAEVLKFRDEAWTKYFTNPSFLSMIESKFGQTVRQNVEEQTKIKLERNFI